MHTNATPPHSSSTSCFTAYFEEQITPDSPRAEKLLGWCRARGLEAKLSADGGPLLGMRSQLTIEDARPEDVAAFRAAFLPSEEIDIPVLGG